MKRLFPYLFTLMALVAVALCLSACGKEEPPIVGDPNSTITGEWMCTDSPLSKIPNIDNHDLVFVNPYEGIDPESILLSDGHHLNREGNERP